MTRTAEKDLRGLSDKTLGSMMAALQCLETEPRGRRVQKLRGYPGQYRMRVGDYRIVYEIDDRERTILVSRIRHRREVYRQ